MSLNIFICEKENDLGKYKIIKDVEVNFFKVRLEENAADERILSQIEKAVIVDSNAFIDRFGFKLDSDFLSTGCKAALETVRYRNCSILNGCFPEESVILHLHYEVGLMQRIIEQYKSRGIGEV